MIGSFTRLEDADFSLLIIELNLSSVTHHLMAKPFKDSFSSTMATVFWCLYFW